MATGPFPAIQELLPQQGPMCLLDRVLFHDRGCTRCAVSVEADSLFALPDGSVPGYLALEWMAQCASAHAALLARARSEAPPMRGLLLGTRALELARARYAPGERLEVEARHLQGEVGLVVFACSVWSAGRSPGSPSSGSPRSTGSPEEAVLLASGRINLYTEPLAASHARP